jgi:DNA modification methylase
VRKGKNKMQKPYYEDSAVTIYHGDCREIVPQLGRFDLLLTDPPYGLKDWNCRGSNTKRFFKPDDTKWDILSEDIDLILSASKKVILWGGQYYSLPPTPQLLIWHKCNIGMHFANCEVAWTKGISEANRIYELSIATANSKRTWEHPTEKPVSLFSWCIRLAGDVQTILDPFAGSGTTGRAAKDLNKKAVLIEREERYCEIAADRMSQEVLAL